MPPEQGADGVYVDPDAGFSIQLKPGAHLEHASGAAGNAVAADVDKGVVTVVYWRQPAPATTAELDRFLEAYTKDGFVPFDVTVPGAAARGRGVRYTVHAPQPDAVGEARIVVREPWVIVLIVHARTGTPFEHEMRTVLDSFQLKP